MYLLHQQEKYTMIYIQQILTVTMATQVNIMKHTTYLQVACHFQNQHMACQALNQSQGIFNSMKVYKKQRLVKKHNIKHR